MADFGTSLAADLSDDLSTDLSTNLAGTSGAAPDFRYSIPGVQASFRRAEDDSNITLGSGAIQSLVDMIPQPRKAVSAAPYVFGAPSAARRPTLESFGGMGLDGSVIAGLDDSGDTRLTAAVGASDVTIYAVADYESRSGSQFVFTMGVGSGRHEVYATTDSGFSWYAYIGTTGASYATGVPAHGTACVQTGRKDEATTGDIRAFRNGGNSVTDRALSTITATSGISTIGSRGGSSNAFYGNVYEILVCLGAHSDAEVSTYASALIAYWTARGVTF